jgi:hypothetical protein
VVPDDGDGLVAASLQDAEHGEVGADRAADPSAPLPKFVIHCSTL